MKTNLKLIIAAVVIVVIGAGVFFLSNTSQKPATPAVVVPPQQNVPRPATPSLTQKKTLSFDNDPVDATPSYVIVGKTGGSLSEWQVKSDPTAPSSPNVLAQTSQEQVTVHFPFAVLSGEKYKDVNVSVSFKTVSGTIDQSGGIIFRFGDANNYYLLRASATENNVVLYKYVNGRSTVIASVNSAVSAGKWQTLTVVAIGESMEGYLDGKRVLEARDATFLLGSVGLRTKADSVTYFDNFTIGY